MSLEKNGNIDLKNGPKMFKRKIGEASKTFTVIDTVFMIKGPLQLIILGLLDYISKKKCKIKNELINLGLENV